VTTKTIDVLGKSCHVFVHIISLEKQKGLQISVSPSFCF